MLAWLKYPKLIVAMIKVVKDPNQLTEVIKLNQEFFDATEAKQLLDFYRRSPQTSEAFFQRPALGNVQVKDLLALAPGSLGEAYGRFLQSYNLDPQVLQITVGSDDTAFILNHLYESHDLWHVVTGFPTDVIGELGLQAFYAAQSPARFPTAILALGLLNTILFAAQEKDQRLDAIAVGWRMGKQAKPLFGVDWRHQLERPLASLRQELAIVPYERVAFLASA